MKRGLMQVTSVNITPLLDVLTVLLFFLIKSMSVTSISLTTPDGMRLPASYIESDAEESVVLTLTDTAILIDQKEILKKSKNGYRRKDIGSDERTLIPILKDLEVKFKNRMKLYEGLDEIESQNIPRPKLLIQADRGTLFKGLKYVLHTVALAGYTDYQFITVPKEN